MGTSSLRDQGLTELVRAVLESDHRVAKGGFSWTVRGGVVHFTGHAACATQRQLVREVIGRIRGVYAVWDLLTVPGEERLKVVDLGCGAVKQCRSAIGIDRWPSPEVDLIADLSRGLPFADRTIDRIYAIHFLEHVHQLVELMEEIHRILKPSGVLHVMVPNASCVNALADPTHVRLFHPQTFKYFCRPRRTSRLFKPLTVSSSAADIFVDLQPIEQGECPPSEQLLSLVFD